MKQAYKIANHIVMIDSIYETVHNLCNEYCFFDTKNEDYISIKINEEDIKNEKEIAEKECLLENIPIYQYSDDLYETTAVYRKLAKELLHDNILLCHGSVVAIDNQAYMFIAKSGTGKSTHTRMWREVFGKNAIMVNDDKPLIEINENKAIVFGTPWNGKHCLGSNISVPLKAITILERGSENEIKEISKGDAFPKLLQQTYRIPGKDNMEQIVQLLGSLSNVVKFYKMKCNISHEAAIMAYEKIK